MKNLSINYDYPQSVQDQNHPLLGRINHLVELWNYNAENHFDMACEIANGQLNDDSKSTLLLEFIHADIDDAIASMEDFEWKNGIVSDEWTCGRSGSHVWLHRDNERVLMITCQDPETTCQDPGESECQDPVIEWKHAKWLVYLGVLFLLSRLLQNFVF